MLFVYFALCFSLTNVPALRYWLRCYANISSVFIKQYKVIVSVLRIAWPGNLMTKCVVVNSKMLAIMLEFTGFCASFL